MSTPARFRFSRALLHPVALAGELFVAVGFVASVVALSVDLYRGETRPYQGILTFIVFPGLMFCGAFVMLAGLLLERRRVRKLERAQQAWRPALDPMKRLHRRILIASAVGIVLFLAATIAGSYRAYEFTESPVFCGELCHAPMEPQYSAYHDSPHARVPCVICHVGPGVDRYLDAKLSGLRQVREAVEDSYVRPIRAPREKILPANETCERCHWPERFVGVQLDNRVRFGYDVLNSRRSLRILMKVGGGDADGRAQEGIHWHVHNDVLFRARDELDQDIPWVKLVRPDGTSVVYEDRERRPEPGETAALEEKRMDCLDCHNRPAHQFLTLDEAVDRALESGELDRSLPFIKKLAVETLAGRYRSREDAADSIRTRIESYYRDNFDGVVLARRQALDSAVASVQRLYRRNVFPEMHVDWSTYPDNIGHRAFPGCFRCHGGKHASADGRPLRSDCNLCHVFVEKLRDSESLVEVAADASFLHPFAHEEHGKVACWSCHTGAASPYARCQTCHEEAAGAHGMRFECSICHLPGKPEVTSATCAPCHPTSESPLHAHRDHGDCLACHESHNWKVAYRERCSPCHATLGKDSWESHYPGQACSPCHDFRGVLAHLKGLPVSRKE
jgi:hypothetical protein